jgi:hypothetical protein
MAASSVEYCHQGIQGDIWDAPFDPPHFRSFGIMSLLIVKELAPLAIKNNDSQ